MFILFLAVLALIVIVLFAIAGLLAVYMGGLILGDCFADIWNVKIE
jgi:hypothetical protein